MNGILGIKVGMSQVFTSEGEQVPVTLISTNGCVVVQAKTKDRDGYDALQLGIGLKSQRCIGKALKKHFEKAKTKPTRWLREIREEESTKHQPGEPVALDFLKPGDVVKISGITKGRGFTGAMKRWNFEGGPGAHGSRFHRTLGSIGNKTYPKRVFKRRPMHGHYGNERCSVRNVVIDILKDENLLVVKGAVPGKSSGLLEIRKI